MACAFETFLPERDEGLASKIDDTVVRPFLETAAADLR